MPLRLLLALIACCLPTVTPAATQEDLLPIESAFVLSATAPERGRIELNWQIAEGYYLYRHRITVAPVTSDFKANPLDLPEGKTHQDEFFGEVQTYRGSLTAIQTGAAASGVERVQLVVGYQGCADIGICYPPHWQTLTVALPAEATPASRPALLSLDRPAAGGLFSAPGDARAALPLPETEAYRVEAVADGPERIVVRFVSAPGYYLYRDKTTFAVAGEDGGTVIPGEWPEAQTRQDEYFGEQAVYFDEVLLPLRVQRSRADAQVLRLQVGFMGCQDGGICYPPMRREIRVELPAAPAGEVAATPSSWRALLGALFAALLGGLILNLMPCVLPVLALKALGLASSGESPAKARAHALWYTAGVVLSFTALGAVALALREAGLALGWGFQLQQPVVVAGLALLMFAIGLSLSGVFQIGGSLAGVGQSLTRSSGPAGDFFTGVLAVVVAAPCTAPLMGAALAYAFAAPTAAALGVFIALGVGLSLPFLAIGFVPALGQWLPRPGAWMDTLKQALAFPMYLTAVWLVWVLAKQRGADAVGWVLGGAVVLALGLWLGEFARYRPVALRLLAGALALAGLAALWPIHQLASAHVAPAQAGVEARDGSQPWSAATLARLRAEGRVVFVNMTADWCVTCKANEKTVLATDAFAESLRQADAVYLKGDWTDVDPAITGYLREHGAVGVPFYAVYPAGGGEPVVLPNLLTPGIVSEALAAARP